MEKYPIEEIKKIICEEGQDKKIVKKADQLVSNLIQFDGKWDMEPCLKIYKWDSSHGTFHQIMIQNGVICLIDSNTYIH